MQAASLYVQRILDAINTVATLPKVAEYTGYNLLVKKDSVQIYSGENILYIPFSNTIFEHGSIPNFLVDGTFFVKFINTFSSVNRVLLTFSTPEDEKGQFTVKEIKEQGGNVGKGFGVDYILYTPDVAFHEFTKYNEFLGLESIPLNVKSKQINIIPSQWSLGFDYNGKFCVGHDASINIKSLNGLGSRPYATITSYALITENGSALGLKRPIRIHNGIFKLFSEFKEDISCKVHPEYGVLINFSEKAFLHIKYLDDDSVKSFQGKLDAYKSVIDSQKEVTFVDNVSIQELFTRISTYIMDVSVKLSSEKIGDKYRFTVEVPNKGSGSRDVSNNIGEWSCLVPKNYVEKAFTNSSYFYRSDDNFFLFKNLDDTLILIQGGDA